MCLDHTVKSLLHSVQLFFTLAAHLAHLVLCLCRLLICLLGDRHRLLASRLGLLLLLLCLLAALSRYLGPTCRGFRTLACRSGCG
jgi:hypothetical protein